MARRLPDLQRHVAERDPLAVGQVPDRVVGLGAAPIPDPGPRGGGELQMPGQEVGVEMGVQHADDRQPLRGGIGEVLGHIAAGVDDNG
ncbi:MAG TPA: hypothetical protein VGN28_06980, partial [Blastococcus sp.]|nr:hypothetical protein [Blastococcus sp.]